MKLPAFGPGIAAALQPVSGATFDTLPKEEQALVNPDAVSKRKQEFAAGRFAAHAALAQLGVTNFPVLRDGRRAPIWPATMVGSISHSTQFAIACAARKMDYLGIGVDIQSSSEAVSPEARERILTESEHNLISTLPAQEQNTAVLQIFSAKECYYKACAPLTGEYIPFSAIEINHLGDKTRGTVLKEIIPQLPIGTTLEWKIALDDYIVAFFSISSPKCSM